MKKIFLLSIGFAGLFAACSYEYDMGPSNQTEKDRLVVNSILNPNQPLSIFFHVTCRTDSGYGYRTVKDVRVVLKEDGQVFYDAVCPDTVLQLAHPVKEGAGYSIAVGLDGYEAVSATTTIPYPIESNCSDEKTGDSWSYLIKLSGFKFSRDDESSLWVTAYQLYENGTIAQYAELYTNNLFVDKVNEEAGMSVRNPVVGSLYYDGFLRVKNKNLPDLEELVFTPAGVYYTKKTAPTDSEIERIGVKLIAASREYDRYNRTLFQQKSMIIYDDDISSIVYQPIPVYSNIKNGLGIFAGMNETNYYLEYP
jgi:hypothetical protein